MKATWDRLEKNVMQFRVEVEAERFSRAVDAAFRKLVRNARIPGFRPGKAPRFVFERYYGKETLIQQAVEDLLPEVYAEALEAGQVQPIDQPKIELEQAEEGKDFIFKGTVQVKPEVKLGRLDGFGLTYPDTSVTDEQVDAQLNQLRERMAQLVPDETGEVRQGSFVVVDFEGYIDGEKFEGGSGEGVTVEVGAGQLIPGFEEQLVGMKAGEEKEIQVTFPEDYPVEHLRGKAASFKVKVRDVKRKELPALDDAFAASVSRFQTLQELRADIQNKLREVAERQAEENFRNQVVEAVTAEAEVEVPEVLTHRRIHTLIDEFAHSLSHQGMTLEAYLQATGKDLETLHKEFEEPARKQVKTELVLEAVAKQEGLEVTEAEIDAEFEAMARLYRSQAREIDRLRRNPEYRERVRENLLRQKAVSHLVERNRPAAQAQRPAEQQQEA
ncbi:MAG: trigger factor [Firmicutes bacterium]|nr:trigger factor [Bacillota bacterium]